MFTLIPFIISFQCFNRSVWLWVLLPPLLCLLPSALGSSPDWWACEWCGQEWKDIKHLEEHVCKYDAGALIMVELSCTSVVVQIFHCTTLHPSNSAGMMITVLSYVWFYWVTFSETLRCPRCWSPQPVSFNNAKGQWWNQRKQGLRHVVYFKMQMQCGH